LIWYEVVGLDFLFASRDFSLAFLFVPVFHPDMRLLRLRGLLRFTLFLPFIEKRLSIDLGFIVFFLLLLVLF
jgi:hypothetical protein